MVDSQSQPFCGPFRLFAVSFYRAAAGANGITILWRTAVDQRLRRDGRAASQTGARVTGPVPGVCGKSTIIVANPIPQRAHLPICLVRGIRGRSCVNAHELNLF